MSHGEMEVKSAVGLVRNCVLRGLLASSSSYNTIHSMLHDSHLLPWISGLTVTPQLAGELCHWASGQFLAWNSLVRSLS